MRESVVGGVQEVDFAALVAAEMAAFRAKMVGYQLEHNRWPPTEVYRRGVLDVVASFLEATASGGDPEHHFDVTIKPLIADCSQVEAELKPKTPDGDFVFNLMAQLGASFE